MTLKSFSELQPAFKPNAACGPFRNVPRDLGEPQQAAGCIANSVYYDISHEGGSVLTAAPTFRFVFSGPLRCCEGGSGQSYLAVIFGIETREVMADDFGR